MTTTESVLIYLLTFFDKREETIAQAYNWQPFPKVMEYISSKLFKQISDAATSHFVITVTLCNTCRTF